VVVLNHDKNDKVELLLEIASSYVRKDIKDLSRIDNITDFNRLIQLYARQCSKLVNVAELSSTLQRRTEGVTGIQGCRSGAAVGTQGNCPEVLLDFELLFYYYHLNHNLCQGMIREFKFLILL